MSAIMDAIRAGDSQQVKALINAEPTVVQSVDDKGFTPLIMATYLDQEAIVRLLLDADADINAVDKMGNTALMGVAFKGNLPLLKFLLQHGADYKLRNNHGMSAHGFAVQFGQEAIRQHLESLP